jgi:hypothetical protein
MIDFVLVAIGWLILEKKFIAMNDIRVSENVINKAAHMRGIICGIKK